MQCYNFEPHFHPERLHKIPRSPSYPRIFVVAHGDLFGRWVDHRIIYKILAVCSVTHKEMWFFESKNPKRYLEFKDFFPKNTVLSTTIETNREYPVAIRGSTPSPMERFIAMQQVKQATNLPIHISIEPILNFDLTDMIGWMQILAPTKVAVGYDTLNNNLPGPPKWKTMKLIRALEKFTDVERKQL